MTDQELIEAIKKDQSWGEQIADLFSDFTMAKEATDCHVQVDKKITLRHHGVCVILRVQTIGYDDNQDDE